MKKQAVLAFFGSRIKTANAIGITPAGVGLWGEDIPKTSHAAVRMAMELHIFRSRLGISRHGKQVIKDVDLNLKNSLESIGDK